MKSIQFEYQPIEPSVPCNTRQLGINRSHSWPAGRRWLTICGHAEWPLRSWSVAESCKYQWQHAAFIGARGDECLSPPWRHGGRHRVPSRSLSVSLSLSACLSVSLCIALSSVISSENDMMKATLDVVSFSPWNDIKCCFQLHMWRETADACHSLPVQRTLREMFRNNLIAILYSNRLHV